jgi:hypothetical protein
MLDELAGRCPGFAGPRLEPVRDTRPLTGPRPVGCREQHCLVLD